MMKSEGSCHPWALTWSLSPAEESFLPWNPWPHSEAETSLCPWALLSQRALVICCASVSCLEEVKEDCGMMLVCVALRGAASGSQPHESQPDSRTFYYCLLIWGPGRLHVRAPCAVTQDSPLPRASCVVQCSAIPILKFLKHF